MNVKLAYGRGNLTVALPDDRTTVITPSHNPGLPDEKAAVINALQTPIGAPSLGEILRASHRVCVAFTDLTRATPNERIIPWLLEFMKDMVPRENVTLLNQLGTHRPNTRAELETMLTPEVVAKYRVLNHEPENSEALVQLGATRDG